MGGFGDLATEWARGGECRSAGLDGSAGVTVCHGDASAAWARGAEGEAREGCEDAESVHCCCFVAWCEGMKKRVASYFMCCKIED